MIDENWYLKLEDEQQILYYAERPIFKFRVNKEYCNNPSWIPISLELPTRPLPKIGLWIQNKNSKTISLIRIKGKLMVENWIIKQATAKHSIIRKSKVLDYNVLVVSVVYTYASGPTQIRNKI